MNLRSSLFFLLLVFNVYRPFKSIASTTKKDSLKNALLKAKEDTNKVNLLFDLGYQYEYFNSKERINYFIGALQLANKLEYGNGIKRISPYLITNLFHRNMYDVALNYCLKYIDFLEKHNEKEELLRTYNLFANLLCKQQKYDEAMPYYAKAMNYFASVNDLDQYAITLNNICLLYLNKNNTDSAFVYGTKAAEIFKKNNNSSRLANSILGLGEINLIKNDLVNARKQANESKHIYESTNILLGIANAKMILGKIDLLENKIDSALTNFKDALAISMQMKNYSSIRDCYLNIAQCYKSKKLFENAFENHALYSMYDDTLASESLNAKMLEMEVKYDISKKENELLQKDFEITTQNRQRNYLIGIVGIVLMLFVISYRAYTQKRKANHLISEQKKLVEEKAAEVAERQKEILDSIKYAKRIQTALITNDKYIEKSLNRLNENN